MVKYLKPKVSEIDKIGEKNLKQYPVQIQRVRSGNAQLTIRSENSSKNAGGDMVVMDENDLILGMASNEWGATLIRVAKEYRGSGLGKLLGKYWYQINPKYLSGGFTAAGERNAMRIWADRVLQLSAGGYYSTAVRDGVITPDKAKKILAVAKEYAANPSKEVETTTRGKLLVYTDDVSIILYDEQYFKTQDDKFVYGHAFLRNSDDKSFVFSIDYEPWARKLTHLLIFQLARDNNDSPLWVGDAYGDVLEIDDIEQIDIDGDYAQLTTDVIDLVGLASREKLFRSEVDHYSEILYQLIDAANSKWS